MRFDGILSKMCFLGRSHLNKHWQRIAKDVKKIAGFSCDEYHHPPHTFAI